MVQFIDTGEFTRLGSALEGRYPLADLHRFCEGLPEQPNGWVNWSIKGRRQGDASFLDVTIKAQPVLECQRCLEPFVYDIDVSNRVQLVAHESDLETDEAEDEDAIERILGARRFDVSSFIEDELILALPYVARHDVCPSGQVFVQAEAPVEQEDRPSPFAALEQLKKKY